MGCGASNDTSRVKTPLPNQKSVLPPIDTKPKSKTPSAKSNGSTDSGIEDSEPIQRKPNSTKPPQTIDDLLVEHHQKSRLGYGETFDIMATAKPGRLAPLRHVPRVINETKTNDSTDKDLQAKIAAKLERASRKRREIEDARRQAASRIGHRPVNKSSGESVPITTTDQMNSTLREERRQQLTMLRDQLRRSASNNSLSNPLHTPRTPRPDSVNSGIADITNLTPRRGAMMIGATTASNFKAVYD